MLVRHRVMIVSAICCALAATAVPSVALAHGGGGRYGYRVRLQNRAQRLCVEAGVPLNGQKRGEGRGPSGLSEAQVKELKTACEKLAAAYAAQRKADEAASKTFGEARTSDRTKLNGACPALTEHHERGAGEPIELSAACKEALKSYGTAVREAEKACRKALDEAGKTFATALSEFETAVKPVLTALETAAREHRHHHGEGSSGEGSGPSGRGQAGPAGWPGPGHREAGGGYR